MNLFEHLEKHQYGEVHVRRDAASGLMAIVAIHDTRLGPSLGGCRFIPYAHEELALIDALRLARGMTYKAAITGLPLGGGKSVILRPAKAFDRAALFTEFGRFVNGLGGRYITAEDSGTSVEDMVVIRGQTKHVTGLPPKDGGGGDPSPFTALGVRRGIEACVRHVYGRDLSGIDYYVAFSCWRLAVISEGVYARYLHGAMGNQEGVDLTSFKTGTEGLAERDAGQTDAVIARQVDAVFAITSADRRGGGGVLFQFVCSNQSRRALPSLKAGAEPAEALTRVISLSLHVVMSPSTRLISASAAAASGCARRWSRKSSA